jgi:cytochrome c nitrite reductase small subunit
MRTKWLAISSGLLLGLGAFTFEYAEGGSYFSTDPVACVNCHVMKPYYDSWQQSSHHTVATCVDCHLPHGFVGKYLSKADNGFHHSWAFTFQNFHEPIQIKPRNARILQANCIACHGDLVHGMLAAGVGEDGDVRCVHCHADVGHGP